MKKFTNILLLVLLCLSMLVLPACSSVVAPNGDKLPPIITTEQMDKNLKEFLQISEMNPGGIGGSRVFTSESATAAAQLLYNKYTATTGAETPEKVYKNLEVMPLESTTFDLKYTLGNKSDTRQAMNVIVRYKSATAKPGEQIIIGANYDNSFGEPDKDKIGSTSLGAIENATGVATLMSIIDYVSGSGVDYGFDIVFCFFAGSYGSAGSLNYISEIMTPEQKINTLLMFNLYRLGGERTYIYSDEVPTQANEFLHAKGAAAGLEFYKTPKNMPIIDKKYVSKLPYFHYGMMGDHAAFIEKGIPVANLYGGYYGGLNLSDLEQSNDINLGSTADDTYANLVKRRPNYSSQMADAATLIINSITDKAFAGAMIESKANTYDYSFWANPLWAQLIVLGVIVLLIVLIILLVKYFEKKYPFKPIVRKLKIAVFGLDYETQTAEDIFVDIKKKRDPFSGY